MENNFILGGAAKYYNFNFVKRLVNSIPYNITNADGKLMDLIISREKGIVRNYYIHPLLESNKLKVVSCEGTGNWVYSPREKIIKGRTGEEHSQYYNFSIKLSGLEKD